MKVFFGLRTSQGCQVFTWDTLCPKRPAPLNPARQLWDHSPTGYEWGYPGSGPAQLALALLFACTGNGDFAISMHQSLKAEMLQDLPRDVWARTELEVLECAMRAARTPESLERAEYYLSQRRQANDQKGR